MRPAHPPHSPGSSSHGRCRFPSGVILLLFFCVPGWVADKREVQPLNDRWLFQLVDDEGADVKAAQWTELSLPHTWNAADGSQVRRAYRRGVGYYQRSLQIPETWRGRHVFLTIGAANARAQVSLNGRMLLEHRTGFTAFVADLTPHLRVTAEQDLQVTVDNRHNLDYPPLVSDYTFFGGIHRQAWLTVTDPIHISLTHHGSSGVFLSQRTVDRGRAEVDARIVLVNDRASAATGVTVSVDILDQAGTAVASVRSDPLLLPVTQEQQVTLPIVIDRPRLWDGRADPYRYQARVRVWEGDRLADEVSQPLGLRSFSVDPNRGFLLNGRPYDLHGPSLHQDHAEKGWAISDQDRIIDVGLLQELGATAVRLVHYPHAPKTFDLLDRAGIIAWSEIPVAYRIGNMPAYSDNCQTMLKEMIRQLYNHPSICFWGLYNEMTALRQDHRAFITGLHRTAKELDPGRLTTGAAGAMETDPICDITDCVAFNRYFGWFIPKVNLFAPWAASSHRMFPDRRIGVAEYGAEGNPALHADRHTPQTSVLIGRDSRMGTEEYQANLHEELWLQMADKPYLWCKFGWTLADWSTGGLKGPTPWPNEGVGLMGLVTHDRKLKKDAFYWYQANWSSQPMLHIAERRFTPRLFREFDLRVYSNLPGRLTVTLNGEPLKTHPEILGKRFIWPSIQAPPGRVRITVVGQAEGKVFSDSVEWELPDRLPPPQARKRGDEPAKPPEKPDF
jgi:beta-galactosidase